VIAGSGVGGTGAIVNTGSGQNHGLGSITLTADATIGGSGRWDLRPIVAGTGVLDLAGNTLTKTGSGIVALVDSVFTSGGAIQVNEGELRYTRNSTGATVGQIALAANTLLTFENQSAGNFGWDLAVDNAMVRNLGTPLVTLNSNVALTQTATFEINPAVLTITGNLTGTGNLLKTGAQTLTLLGDASHSGGTTVTAGTLQIGDGNTSGTISGDIANAGTVVFNRADSSSYTGVISGTGAIQKNGAGTLDFSGANSYTGTLTINAGTIRLVGADNRLSVASIPVLANTAGATLDLNGLHQELRGLSGGGLAGGSVVNSAAVSSVLTLRPDGGDNSTFAGVIDGDVRLEIVGNKTSPSFIAPRQRLAGTANTFTGGILVDGATLMARQDGSLGAVPVAFEPAHITLQNNGTLLNEADGNALTLHANRGISLGTGGGALVAGFNQNLTVQGQISGSAGNHLAVLQNNGTVLFTGDNTYAGDTLIQGTGPNGIGRLTIGDGGTSGTLGSGNVVNDGQLTINRSDSYTYGGEISGLGTLTQAGAGTTTLTGTHSYSGATTVSAGTLTLAAGGSLGATAVTVQSAGTLAGAGVIGGNVSVAGTLAAGNSTGTLEFAGNLTLADASAYVFEYTGGGTAADLSQVGGALDLSGTITLNLIDLGTYTLGDKFTLFAYESLTGGGLIGGHADGDVFFANGGDWQILYADAIAGLNGGAISGNPGSGFITLTAVPEPSAAALLALAAALAARRRRS
jgi:fibronectin-binding autotransporter adhesin